MVFEVCGDEVAHVVTSPPREAILAWADWVRATGEKMARPTEVRRGLDWESTGYK